MNPGGDVENRGFGEAPGICKTASGDSLEVGVGGNGEVPEIEGRGMGGEHVAEQAAVPIREVHLKKIGTHNGTFHCDEVLACVMLKKLPHVANAEIIRSRDPAVLATCDVVIDVGGIYNHDLKRYDHHQPSFTFTMADLVPQLPYVIKLSSAGLIYAHYGKQVVRQMLGEVAGEEELDAIWKRMYSGLVREVDAIDNGVSQADGPLRYRIITGLSSRVGGLNVSWNAPEMNETSQFLKAIELVDSEFTEMVNYLHTSWWPARHIVLNAIETRSLESPEQSQVIVLQTFCPWGQHLLELEEELAINPLLKFVLFQDTSNTWRVRAVPAGDSDASFTLRVPLKQSWRGLRDAELCAEAKIPGCIFVHMSGFIGGNLTQSGAMSMALESIRAAAEEQGQIQE